jgi:polyhydroxybutyrate depolymerase
MSTEEIPAAPTPASAEPPVEPRRRRWLAWVIGVVAVVALARRDPVTTCHGVVSGERACRIRFDFDHRERRARLRVPVAPPPKAGFPLILVFHGAQATADWQVAYTLLEDAATRAGFAIVHPDGNGKDHTWNAGTCCGSAMHDQVDDVAFVRELLVRLDEHLPIDRRRIHVAGISNGGMFADRLACELSNQLASVAMVSAPPFAGRCPLWIPIPTLVIHGAKDSLVPATGRESATDDAPAYPDLMTFATNRASQYDCADPVERPLGLMGSACTSWTPCRFDGEVELCILGDGGHTWPGAKLELTELGPTSRTLDANRELLKFFQRHVLTDAAHDGAKAS